MLAQNILETGGVPYFIVEEEDTGSHQPIENANIITGNFGTYAKAINYGYKHTTEPFVFAGADDLVFHPGWLEEAFKKEAPVVGTNDLGNQEVLAGEHATHYLVDRKYLDKVGGDYKVGPGSFLPEAYDHNWTDREFIETAKLRGAFAPCLESMVEHMHVTFGKMAADPTFEKTRRNIYGDQEVYEKRLAEIRELHEKGEL